jgi:hypothetical protein
MSGAIRPPALLGDFADFVDAVSADPLDKNRANQAAYRLLLSLLKGVQELLEAAPSDLSVRQLAVQLIRCVPVKAYRAENKSDLADRVLRCGPVPLRGSYQDACVDALAESCGELSTQIALALRELSGDANRSRRRLNLPLEAREPRPDVRTLRHRLLPDGPTPDGLFAWNGETEGYDFSRQEWRLLRELWDGRPVFKTKLRQNLNVNDGNLRKLKHTTREKLQKYRLPIDIITSSTGSTGKLQLKRPGVTV